MCLIFIGQNLCGQNRTPNRWIPNEFILQFKSSNDFSSFLNQNSETNGRFEKIANTAPDWNIYLFRSNSTTDSPYSLLTQLRQNPGIANAQFNTGLTTRLKPNDAYFNSQWQHNNDGSQGGVNNVDMDTDLAWDLSTSSTTEAGDSIVICIIDDGLQMDHEDIFENLYINYKEIPNNKIDDDVNGYIDDHLGWNTDLKNDKIDPGVHGTPVTGLAGAKGNNKKGIAGVMWNTKILFIQGGSNEANAIESYHYAWNARKLYNETNGLKGAFIVATNTSWGADYAFPEDAPLWCAVYDSLGSVGILNAASTANLDINVDQEGDLPTTCESDYLITTTNLNWLNNKEPGSAFGSKSIDLGTYGENVLSTSIGNSYKSFSGTSAAAPSLTGAIGFLYSLPCNNLPKLARSNPAAAAYEAKQLLLAGTKSNSDLKGITVTGGSLNIYQSALLVSPLEFQSIQPNEIRIKILDSLAQFPIYLQYKLKGTGDWTEMTIYSNEILVLKGLEPCSEYEFRIRGLCSKYINNFSPIRTYKTIGCCEPLAKFKIENISANQCNIQLLDLFIQDTVYLSIVDHADQTTKLRYIRPDENRISITGLEPCNTYDLYFAVKCNDKLLIDSTKLIKIKTEGCQSCSELQYCQRVKSKSNFEWIHSVSLNGQRIVTENNGGFGNFVGTEKDFQISSGSDHLIQIEPAYFIDSSELAYGAWIDFNLNGEFDSEEQLLDPTVRTKEGIKNRFQIPSGTKAGIYRLRCVAKFAELNTTDAEPCFSGLEFGESEDYCVYISNQECSDKISTPLIIIMDSVVQFNFPTHYNIKYLLRDFRSTILKEDEIYVDHLRFQQLDPCTNYIFSYKASCAVWPNYQHIHFTSGGLNCSNRTHSQLISHFDIQNDKIVLSEDQMSNISKLLWYDLAGRLIESVDPLSEVQIPPIIGFYLLRIKYKNGEEQFLKLQQF